MTERLPVAQLGVVETGPVSPAQDCEIEERLGAALFLARASPQDESNV
jgi:hypothetical protein